MRSRQEIAFRLGQELANLKLLWRAPELSADIDCPTPLRVLPQPSEIRPRLVGTAHARQIQEIAGSILAHRFPLLGITVETGPEIHWRRDYANARETEPLYLRRIPYLDFARAGDHKVIWELNRHQHLVLLAQAHCLEPDRDRLVLEIEAQLDSWHEQNPFQKGMNWTSALEVAFRALSWIFIYHWAGGALSPGARRRLLEELYRHGLHLEHNLSIYFSPNTHLLGEAVVLHALGRLFPELPGSERWSVQGGRIVCAELERQVRQDGSYFEQSTYYHVYAADMLLFHAVIAGEPFLSAAAPSLGRMAEFLERVIGPSGRLPFLGDDDGGRFFFPYGSRERFGLATLGTFAAVLGRKEFLRCEEDLNEQAVWWLGARAVPAPLRTELPMFEARWFAGAGIATVHDADVHLVIDAGPFGPGTGGHSHADALSFVLRRGGQDVLLDPGTYCYVGDVEARDRFRGTASHNTIRIDGLDQATAAGPFRWVNPPSTSLLHWSSGNRGAALTAEAEYRGFRHLRRFLYSDGLLVVLDEIEGPPGIHILEQFWHCGGPVRPIAQPSYECAGAIFTFTPGADIQLSEGGEFGWCSPVLLARRPAPLLTVRLETELPACMVAVIDLTGAPPGCLRELAHGQDGGFVYQAGTRRIRIIADGLRLVRES